ncbi:MULTISPECIES: PEGA domain-containing protein [unclassified Methanoregula]|uniref:PEGA domain-containing protein n=1 Tax=unclassified Methanoregula TaxID=2649730 RepID=UPI0009D1D352|nr:MULTISPECIES: PEGA domain-containing protein [unclassified Methanoregula]OPX64649.1 MAG: PEGA domain protein [Methanoregula sp. PtaB.Bin085]OPY36017.1 MAG: PEGA domain protein [Methanoregula sp. PtaU1.Bin006]
MRSLLILVAALLILAGTAAAFQNITANDSIYYKEVGGATCADHAIPGLKGQSLLAIVELSGHSEVTIDGKQVQADGSGTYQEHPVNYYVTTPGTHHIVISQPGYTYYIAYRSVCAGKVTYAYYDQEAHLFQGTTRSPVPTTVPVTATSTVTATPSGGSPEYGALKSALGTQSNPENLGSLAIATDPPGAVIYIDGIKQGITPATIPGIAPGSHTLLLRLDGYDDLSIPVVVSAGRTHTYSSALQKSSGAAAPAPVVPTTKRSGAPGAGIVAAACLIAAGVVLCRKSP